LADGYHSLNQLSLSFGMFFFCCHTCRARSTGGPSERQQEGKGRGALDLHLHAARGESRPHLKTVGIALGFVAKHQVKLVRVSFGDADQLPVGLLRGVHGARSGGREGGLALPERGSIVRAAEL
jgi:hypothetical protein